VQAGNFFHDNINQSCFSRSIGSNNRDFITSLNGKRTVLKIGFVPKECAISITLIPVYRWVPVPERH
jgi:hypothetical protein